VSDFEREVYQLMGSTARCLMWLVKALEMCEYSKCLTKADRKVLAQVLESIVKEAQG